MKNGKALSQGSNSTDTKKVATEKVQNRDFIRVGKSKIQGKGVFAKRKIPKGTRIIEYTGDRVPKESLFVEMIEGKLNPVYIFSLNDSTVIDGARNGNEARFVNHSCDPNCDTYIFDEKVYVYAGRDIVRGEELTFDYKLRLAFKKSKKNTNLDVYNCLCGSENCRGTMLQQKRKQKKKI